MAIFLSSCGAGAGVGRVGGCICGVRWWGALVGCINLVGCMCREQLRGRCGGGARCEVHLWGALVGCINLVGCMCREQTTGAAWAGCAGDAHFVGSHLWVGGARLCRRSHDGQRAIPAPQQQVAGGQLHNGGHPLGDGRLGGAGVAQQHAVQVDLRPGAAAGGGGGLGAMLLPLLPIPLLPIPLLPLPLQRPPPAPLALLPPACATPCAAVHPAPSTAPRRRPRLAPPAASAAAAHLQHVAAGGANIGAPACHPPPPRGALSPRGHRSPAARRRWWCQHRRTGRPSRRSGSARCAAAPPAARPGPPAC